MSSAMTHRERFRALMTGEPVDRLPRVEWAPWWNKTLDRWRDEGLPVQEHDVYAVANYWRLDPWLNFHCLPKQAGPDPVSHGAGVMKDEDDYVALQPYLYNDPTEEQLENWGRLGQRQEQGDLLVWCVFEGFFWYPRTMFGIEGHLYAFYDYPDLMHRMNRELTDYYLRILPKIARVCTPAFLSIAEDMSYNHGPMLSKALFDEFLAPCYRRLIPGIKEHLDAPVMVDSDGQVEDLIPWWIEVGVDGVLPLERQAGVDGMKIRRAYPTFGLIGHFDKMTMSRGERAMREEFERLLPLMKTGRFLPSVDHQTPPNVSMENYRIYRRLLDEYTLCATA